MGLFTFLKSLFSSKEFVTDGAPKFEIPVTKEIEVVSEPVKEVTIEQPAPKKPRAPKKTSAKPKKAKTAKKKSDS